MSETKNVWLVNFDDMSSLYVIADNIKTAMKKSIKIHNKSFSEELTEENISSIKFVCYTEE